MFSSLGSRAALLLLLTALVPACGDAASSPLPVPGSQGQIQWEHIKTWSGWGSQSLDSFPRDGALRIEWEATAVPGAATPGSLEVTLHSAINGRALPSPSIDHAGEGKGVAYFSEEPRVVFISVTSHDLNWKLNVSERVR